MGYVEQACLPWTPRVPDTAANCPDIMVRFLGLGGLSAGEAGREGLARGTLGRSRRLSPHGRAGGEDVLPEGRAGLKREACWLADSGYLSGKKGWEPLPQGTGKCLA